MYISFFKEKLNFIDKADYEVEHSVLYGLLHRNILFVHVVCFVYTLVSILCVYTLFSPHLTYKKLTKNLISS